MEKQLYFSPAQFMVEAPFCLVAGDAKAYTLVFHAEEPVTGKMLLTADRADGETVIDMAEFSGKICRYTMCNAMYEVPGPLSVTVSVQCGDTILTSNRLSFRVLPAANAGTVEAQDRYPVLTQLIFEVTDAVNFAESALNAITEAQNRLLPEASADRAGNILCLRKKENTTLRYFTADLENNSEYVLGAGVLDKDTAFIELDADLFEGANISDGATFGFTFIPVEADASYDYDVVAEEITQTEQGYLFAFPTESCPLMDSVSADSLLDVFESVQINGEYPEKRVEAVWETPENVIPDTFLEQHAISPALKQAREYADSADTDLRNAVNGNMQDLALLLQSQDVINLSEAKAYTDTAEQKAKAYADEKTEQALQDANLHADEKADKAEKNAKAYTEEYIDSKIQVERTFTVTEKEGIIAIPDICGKIKKIKAWFESETKDGVTAPRVSFLNKNKSEITYFEMEFYQNDYYVVDFENQTMIAYNTEDPDDINDVSDFYAKQIQAIVGNKSIRFVKVTQYDGSPEYTIPRYTAKAEITYETTINRKFADSKEYTDTSIQQAVLDSWEVAV